MRKYLSSLAFLFAIYVTGLFLFTFFRFILFLYNLDHLQPESAGEWLLQAQAFVKGLWFDNVTSSYIMLLPIVITTAAAACNYYSRRSLRIITGMTAFLYLLAFSLSAANIPYFRYFFKNINSSVLNWMEYGSTTLGMMAGESSYWFAIGGFFGISALYLFALRRGVNYLNDVQQTMCPRSSFVTSLSIILIGAVLTGGCLLGIRGRLGYNPIKVSAAYYCNDPFLNQLGLNAAYNLFITTMDDSRSENKRLNLMREEDALKEVSAYFGKQLHEDSRFVRPVSATGTPIRKNVVMVFMESMSADLVGSHKGKASLTPFLDSLTCQSLNFSRIFSAGIHTNHGLFSTLYSFPTIMRRNAMKGSDIPLYTGLPTILAENGYENLFFMTHEAQYDNMNAFLRTNGYHRIFSEENYPPEEIVNSFGVPDDYLFEYALPVLNEQAEKKVPFFATLLTISNHPPYVIPDWFKGKSKEKEELVVEYADYCLSRFMAEARKQSWFDNTLFVFLGDHGKIVGTPESEMPDSYNHIPLLFYASDTSPAQNDGLGGQIDIAPTLLGMLNISYRKHHLGVNLLKQQRDCIFYTADNMIGCRDDEYLYIYAPGDGMEFHYRLDERGEPTSVGGEIPERFEYLRNHSFSMLQTTEYLVKEKKTFL